MAVSRSAIALALMAAVARLVGSQTIDSLPQCGQDCVIQMLNSTAASLGCPADNLPCLCPKPDFGFGIRDCAIQACGAAVASTVTSAASALCATGTIVPPSTSGPPATAAPPPPAPPAPTTTPTTSSPSSSSTPTPEGSTGTTSPASTQASSSTPTSTVSPPTGNDGTLAGEASSKVGLSTPTKVGLGVGIGVGLVVITVLILLALSRRSRDRGGGPFRSRSSNGSSRHAMPGKSHLQISDPLQGSGRTYANDHQWADYDVQQNELESRSRRYEDMLPRQSPKNMV